jgi:NAD(P)-dependent dehydrogenase (short-subunit alcohol dehydrogenase family)
VSGRRPVLVTGASTGIGRATALELSREGFQVFAGVRRPEDGKAVQDEARGELDPVILDITDTENIAAAAAEIEEESRGAGLAALVNNAGVAYGGPLEFVPLEDIRHQLEVNLIGHLAVTRAMLPALRRRRGRIVNVTSIGGLVATPFFGPYCASKFALEAVSDCLRGELRPWGIRTIAIEPGSIDTGIWEDGVKRAEEIRGRMDPEGERLYGQALDRVEGIAEETGGRGIPPEEVARAIHRAIEARRPRARYLVGRDARVMRLASRLLPARLHDAVMARGLKLP